MMATDNNQNPNPQNAEQDDLDLDLSQLDARKTNNRKVVSIVAGLCIILVLLIAVPLFLKFVVFAPKQEATKTTPDESLQATQQENNSIAAMQNRMEQEKAQQQKLLQQQLEAQERQKAELERRRQEALARQRAMEDQLRNQQTAQQQSQPGARQGNSDAPPTPAERKLMGQVMVNFGDDSKGDKAGAGANNNGLNAMLQTEQFEASSAGMQTIDPRYLLIRGSQIPCVLKTRIVTDYKGVVLCEVTRDVYSQDTSNLLIRRGSTVFGQITQAITQGASRVFINWSSIDTPEHARINVDALGADTLGAAGAPAWMDTHFWQRFGNTLKLMTFSDLLETGKNVASQGSGTNNGYISYDNTTDGVQNLANTTLQKDINIPDTAYINQGTLMNVFVPRDLDFSTIYHDQ